jgi:hypothetical protein
MLLLTGTVCPESGPSCCSNMIRRVANCTVDAEYLNCVRHGCGVAMVLQDPSNIAGRDE